jgi:hypothetical protein
MAKKHSRELAKLPVDPDPETGKVASEEAGETGKVASETFTCEKCQDTGIYTHQVPPFAPVQRYCTCPSRPQ